MPNCICMSVIVNDISKIYGTQPALDKISFSVDAGSVLGVLGPNGAGKSTLLKIITGYLSPSSGEVMINGQKVASDHLEFKKLIGYLPENNPLYLDLYVKEYLRLMAGLYKIPNRINRVEEIMEMTGLGPESHKKIGLLSKGYRQRVGLAQALLHDPSLLILDEPTAGLDPAQLVEIRQLIRSISAEKTVLLSTHIMQEVEAICDKILILNQGKVVALETPEKIKARSADYFRKFLVEFKEASPVSQLSSLPGLVKWEQSGKFKFLLYSHSTDLRPQLFDLAVKNDLVLLTLFEQESSIENSFLELVK